MIDVTIQHSPDEVREAVVQFCARRCYRLTQPWYLEGIRIEAPLRNRDNADDRGFWATVMNSQVSPRVDVDIKKRRRNTSRVRITISDHDGSTRLAYELQAYLHDDRAYEAACPPVCPKCGTNVPNPVARYCGRCGHKFAPQTTSTYDHVLGPPPVLGRENAPNETDAEHVLRPPPRAEPVAETEPEETIVEALDVDFEHLDDAKASEAAPIQDAESAESNEPVEADESPVDSFDMDAEEVEDSTSEGSESTTEAPAGESTPESESEGATEQPSLPRQAEAVTVESDEQPEPEDDSQSDDDARPTRRLLAEE